MKKIICIFLVLLYSSIAKAQENKAISIYHYNVNDQYIESLTSCINKDLKIKNNVKNIKDNRNSIINSKYKIYKHYEAAIEIYFLSFNSIDYSYAMYYYINTDIKKLNKFFNKKDIHFLYGKNAYKLTSKIGKNSLIILTPDFGEHKNGKYIRTPLNLNDAKYRPIKLISDCLYAVE